MYHPVLYHHLKEAHDDILFMNLSIYMYASYVLLHILDDLGSLALSSWPRQGWSGRQVGCGFAW